MRQYNYNYPFALTFKEKYGNNVYLIDCEGELFKVALEILKERYSLCYYPKNEKDCLKDLEKATKIKTDLERIDYAKNHDPHLNDAYRDATIECNSAKLEMEFIKRLKVALKEKNGQPAWEILRERRRHEYEGFDIDYFKNIKTKETK
jgi:hypothetical protein